MWRFAACAVCARENRGLPDLARPYNSLLPPGPIDALSLSINLSLHAMWLPSVLRWYVSVCLSACVCACVCVCGGGGGGLYGCCKLFYFFLFFFLPVILSVCKNVFICTDLCLNKVNATFRCSAIVSASCWSSAGLALCTYITYAGLPSSHHCLRRFAHNGMQLGPARK